MRALAVLALVLAQVVFAPVSYACEREVIARPSCCCDSDAALERASDCGRGCCEIKPAVPDTGIPGAAVEHVPLAAGVFPAVVQPAVFVPPRAPLASASDPRSPRLKRPIFASNCSYRI